MKGFGIMMNKVAYVYVLTIADEVINEDNDFVVVTETKALALNIAMDKLCKSETEILCKYGEYCAINAEVYPTLQIMSFRDWLEMSLDFDEIEGVTLNPKAVVTAENFDKIEF